MGVWWIERWDFYKFLKHTKKRHNSLIFINFHLLVGLICLCLFLRCYSSNLAQNDIYFVKALQEEIV